MPQTMTEVLCARCDNKLSSKNKSPDNLCGYCQRELAPHHGGAKYKEWVLRGKKREVTRDAKNRPQPVNGATSAVVEVRGDVGVLLRRVDLHDLLDEVKRRRTEAAEVLRLIPAEPVPAH